MRKWLSFLCVILFITTLVSAVQRRAKVAGDGVHLFQAYFRDIPINSVSYGEFGLQYDGHDYVDNLFLGIRSGFVISRAFEIDAGLNFINSSTNAGNEQSGLSDLLLNCKYALSSGRTPVGLGGYITLPVGSEEIGGGNLHFGFFSALRHALSGRTILSATAGVDFLEMGRERETVMVLGGGFIHPLSRNTHFVGELLMKTRVDYLALSGGLDHRLGRGRLRGGLGFGLDDGAADLTLMASYQFSF